MLMKQKHKLTCANAKQIDLVDYLKKIGHSPKRVKHDDYWYLSPLRFETTPSFKVNRKMNVWYDHGIGKGGDLINFGMSYYNCNLEEFLVRLANDQPFNFFFHQQKEIKNLDGKISIIDSRKITDTILCNYLHSRHIPLDIANQFCLEVSFELYAKRHLAIGFKNESGGYELRNAYFKGSSRPKEPRLITQKDSNELTVFEGFFDFLSYVADLNSLERKIINLPKIQADALILNSIAFFEKKRELMESYENIYLFLDRDKMGLACTEKALQWSAKYKDQSHYYKGHKDLNDCLVKSIKPQQKQNRRRGLRL